jgi:1,4-dihydroxy-6-naphthoate synthase
MKLTLGFSPCPNDTFIFDAMVHNKTTTEGIEFEYILADVEELNRKAFEGELDITKLSCFCLCLRFFPLSDNGFRQCSGTWKRTSSDK